MFRILSKSTVLCLLVYLQIKFRIMCKRLQIQDNKYSGHFVRIDDLTNPITLSLVYKEYKHVFKQRQILTIKVVQQRHNAVKLNLALYAFLCMRKGKSEWMVNKRKYR